MSAITIIISLIIVLVLALLGLLFFSTASKDSGHRQNVAASSSLKNMVLAQRSAAEDKRLQDSKNAAPNTDLVTAAAEETGLSRTKSSTRKVPISKKLSYADWKISPLYFVMLQVIISVVVVSVISSFASMILIILGFFSGPIFMNALLERGMQKRFNAFDKDYPILLLSYVSLLKTGMPVINGLGSAAEGLEYDSLVRKEIELMIERLRLGLAEEQAIGSFAENVNHPELELFVQSLILSRKHGGQLSQTLERLAKQVRKRQEFRKKAIAAVGLEANSLKVIAVIMSILLVYIFFQTPDLIMPAFSDPTGSMVLQAGIAFIIVGFWWSKQVTKIRV